MGAGLSSPTVVQEPPNYTLDVVLKGSIPVREVLAATQAAGKLILDVYDTQVSNAHISLQQAKTPLLRAGQGARTLLYTELARIAPHVPIVSRGSPLTLNSTREKLTSFWLVDPLGSSDDSATNCSDLSISVALVHKGESVLGVVFTVATGESYWAVKGNGAWRTQADGAHQRAQCGEFSLADPKLKIVFTAQGKAADELTALFGTVERLKAPSTPLGLLKIATGEAQIYAGFAPVYEWDVAAADIIIREAGGALVQAGAMDTQEAPQEDWKDAVLKELPLTYNTAELRVPRFVALGRRRAEASEYSLLTYFFKNSAGK